MQEAAQAQGRKPMETAQFWVVGGEYSDTHFCEALDPGEEWFGPFPDYESAKEEWSKLAWRTVDHCTMRYRIERIDPEVPPCTD